VRAGLTAAAPAGAPSHAYFIAAEREQWNYAPYGSIDNCTGTAIGDAQTVRAHCMPLRWCPAPAAMLLKYATATQCGV